MRITSLYLYAFSALAISNARLVNAIEVHLPAIGTNVNFDYQTPPNLLVGTNLTSDLFTHAEITFADAKRLYFEFEPDWTGGQRFIQFDLQFRAPNLFQLFEPIFISFDEQVSLVLDNGQVTPPVKNTGIGAGLCDPDFYTFSWSLHPDSDFVLSGIQWNITPDLIAGVSLPAALDIRMAFCAGGRTIVVPEPAWLATLVIVGAFCMATGRRFVRTGHRSGWS